MNTLENDKTKIKELTKEAYKAIEDKFGEDIIVLDISNISTLSDFFIIASANNKSQLKAIAESVDHKMHTLGLTLKHSEGLSSGKWVLLDFGSLIVHLFEKEEREFYNLERIWGDAKKLEF